MKISFVMLTWNRKEFLKKNLDSFFNNVSNKHSYEFIILDNGSTDGTVDILKNYKSKITVLYNKENEGLQAYKKLFRMAKGKYIVEIDDDVIEFPKNFDDTMVSYMKTFRRAGALCLDVVQNEFTNGAKPDSDNYYEWSKNEKTVQVGPCGGWCLIIRNFEYKIIKVFFERKKLNMAMGEDGEICRLLVKLLRKKNGVIKDVKCFHACGPYYSQMYGCIERDLKKYEDVNLTEMVNFYKRWSKI